MIVYLFVVNLFIDAVCSSDESVEWRWLMNKEF
jgi:hypothetical protein